MNPLLFWEVMAGVTLQVALLVALAGFLSRFQTTCRNACRLWFACHLLLLAVIGHALLFPHLRLAAGLAPIGEAESSALVRTILRWQLRLGLAASVLWGVGAVSRLAWQASELVRIRQGDGNRAARGLGAGATTCILLGGACLATLVFPPVNLLSSSRSAWSPWPSWTAAALKEAGVVVRDYECFDGGRQLHDLLDVRSESPDALFE